MNKYQKKELVIIISIILLLLLTAIASCKSQRSVTTSSEESVTTRDDSLVWTDELSTRDTYAQTSISLEDSGESTIIEFFNEYGAFKVKNGTIEATGVKCLLHTKKKQTKHTEHLDSAVACVSIGKISQKISNTQVEHQTKEKEDKIQKMTSLGWSHIIVMAVVFAIIIYLLCRVAYKLKLNKFNFLK